MSTDDDQRIRSGAAGSRVSGEEEAPSQNVSPVQLLEAGGSERNWGAAAEIVEKVRPVPWLLWPAIRAVYGRSGILGDPPAQTFAVVNSMVLRGSEDTLLSGGAAPSDPSFEKAFEILGPDVAASLCFIHSVCRKVSALLPKRVCRPLVDDALLRAQFGFYLGRAAPHLGGGRGMLAGFAGRCGLAVQIASGVTDQAQKALLGLASGEEIGAICREIYGCDPLQVSALALIAGGCHRDIAMGIASYAYSDTVPAPGSERSRWYCGFAVVEHLRMNRRERIAPEVWAELALSPDAIDALSEQMQQLQRKGHQWRWLAKSQQADDESAPAES